MPPKKAGNRSATTPVKPAINTISPKQAGGDKVAQCVALFKSYDIDDSGCVDRSEMLRIMWSLNADFSDAELDAVFNKVDLNRDGQIQYSEFIAWLLDDDNARNHLAKGAFVSPQQRTISFRTPLGRVYTAKIGDSDRVMDVRLKACVALNLNVNQMDSIKLVGSDGELHDDGMPMQHIFDTELQVVIETSNRLLTAHGVQIRFWDPGTMEIVDEFEADHLVRQVACSSDCEMAAALVGDQTIYAWSMQGDAATGRGMLLDPGVGGCTLWAHTNPAGFSHCAFSTGEKVCATTGDGQLVAWEAKTGTHIWSTTEKMGGILALVCLAEGMIAVATLDGKLGAWSGKSGKQVWTQRIAEDDVDIFAAPSHDGRTLFAAGKRSGKVCAFDSVTGRRLWREKIGTGIHALLCRAPFNTLTLIQGVGRVKVIVLDGQSGKEIFIEEIRNASLLEGHHQHLFIVCGSKTVQLWDTQNRVLRWQTELRLGVGDAIRSLVFDKDLEQVFVATTCGLIVLDAKVGSVRPEIETAGVDVLFFKR